MRTHLSIPLVTAVLWVLGLPMTVMASDDQSFRSQQPESAELNPFTSPKIETFQLKNGLKVYLLSQHQLPTVTADLSIPNGSYADPKSKTGRAEVCLDLLAKGSKTMDFKKFNENLEDLASEIDVTTAGTSQSIQVRSLKKNIGPTVDMLADLILYPGLDAQELQRIQKEKIAALKQAKGSASELAQLLTPSLLFGPKHPAGRIPSEQEFSRISSSDCQSYHKAAWRPKGASLYLVGDITKKEVLEVFAPLTNWKGQAQSAKKPAPPQTPEGTVFFVDIPGAKQSAVVVTQFGPSRTAKNYFEHEIMAQILGGGFTSRLNMNLREDKGYSYGARGHFDYQRFFTTFVASSAVRSDATLQSVKEILKEIRDLQTGEKPALEAEVNREKNAEIYSLPGSFATSYRALKQYKELSEFDLPLDYYDRYQQNIQKVSLKSVQMAAHNQLQPEKLKILVVGDAEGPMIVRENGKDIPFQQDGKTISLKEGLQKLASELDSKKGRLVILDENGQLRI